MAYLPLAAALLGALLLLGAAAWRRDEQELEHDWGLLLHENVGEALQALRAQLDAEDQLAARALRDRAADDVRRAELLTAGVTYLRGVAHSRLQMLRRLRILSRMVAAVAPPTAASGGRLRELGMALEALTRRPPSEDAPAQLRALTAAQLEAWRSLVAAIR